MSDLQQDAEEAAATVVACVTGGMLDGYLDRLQWAVTGRREVLRIEKSVSNRATLAAGDRVVLSQQMNVAALRGAYGAITAFDDKWVSVRLEKPYGREHKTAVRVPYTGVTKV